MWSWVRAPRWVFCSFSHVGHQRASVWLRSRCPRAVAVMLPVMARFSSSENLLCQVEFLSRLEGIAASTRCAVKWTHWDLNPGPSACEADVIPLHHVPCARHSQKLRILERLRKETQRFLEHPLTACINAIRLQRFSVGYLTETPGLNKFQRHGNSGCH